MRLWLCLQTKGYDPVFGARPVKRAVQRELETGLAKALLRGEFGEDDTGTPLLPLHLPFLAMGLAVQQTWQMDLHGAVKACDRF